MKEQATEAPRGCRAALFERNRPLLDGLKQNEHARSFSVYENRFRLPGERVGGRSPEQKQELVKRFAPLNLLPDLSRRALAFFQPYRQLWRRTKPYNPSTSSTWIRPGAHTSSHPLGSTSSPLLNSNQLPSTSTSASPLRSSPAESKQHGQGEEAEEGRRGQGCRC